MGRSQIIQHFVILVAFGQGPGRADQRALTALNAGGSSVAGSHTDADTGAEALAVHSEGRHPLYLAADIYTAQTANTFGHIPDHARRTVVHRTLRCGGMQAVREAVAVQAHGFAQILQFTVAVAGADTHS